MKSSYLIHQWDKLSAPILPITNLERLLFFDAWDETALTEMLGQYGAGVLTCQMPSGEVVGYCVYSQVFEMAEILRIATTPAHQKTGVAQQLISHLSELCHANSAERMLLEVRADNVPALSFYQKNGFYQIDVRKNYYQTDTGKIDALILQKDL